MCCRLGIRSSLVGVFTELLGLYVCIFTDTRSRGLYGSLVRWGYFPQTWQHEVLTGRSHCLVGNLGSPAENALWWQSEVLGGRSRCLVGNLGDSDWSWLRGFRRAWTAGLTYSGWTGSLRGVLHSGYSRSLLGFYNPDVLGVYGVSTLRMFPESTRVLHSVYSRKLRGFYTPGILKDNGDSTLRIFSETTGILYSGYSRSLRGFYTPDILGVYEDSTLRIFSETTGILHPGYSRRLRGFYTPDTLGDYGDSIVGTLGRDAPRRCETKTRAVDLGRERVGEGGGKCRGCFWVKEEDENLYKISL